MMRRFLKACPQGWRKGLCWLHCATLAALLFLATVAEAQPTRTEFVTGSGFLRSSAGVSVEFAVDVRQLDPNRPVGWMVAAFFSFPQHLFMTFEASDLTSVAVERRTAVVSGSAIIRDTTTGVEEEVEFSAVFEDLNAKRMRSQNDAMSLTLYFPTGAERFSGGIVPGGIEVGKSRG